MTSTGTLQQNKEPSVRETIELMKSAHKKNSQFYFNSGLIFTVILVLDVVAIIGARIEEMNHIAWIGIYVLIVAMGFCFSVARRENVWYKYLTKWYDNKIKEQKKRLSAENGTENT